MGKSTSDARIVSKDTVLDAGTGTVNGYKTTPSPSTPSTTVGAGWGKNQRHQGRVRQKKDGTKEPQSSEVNLKHGRWPKIIKHYYPRLRTH